MYNCYNEAIAWVKKQKKIRLKNTDGYIYVDKHETNLVKTLLGQYYYGIDAKRELYYKMIELGVLNGA